MHSTSLSFNAFARFRTHKLWHPALWPLGCLTSRSIARWSPNGGAYPENGLRKYTMAPIAKSLYFRVCDLPPGTPADVESYLACRIQERLLESEQDLQYSIHKIPACYSTEKSPSSVALIKFADGAPDFLTPLMAEPLDELDVEDVSKDGKRLLFSIDRHFLGFTQLYEPETEHEVTAE
jgi:hypothetical protein